MATEKQTTEKKDDGLLEAGDFVYDEKTNRYVRQTMSPELYRQKNLAAQRQALTAAGLGTAGEIGSFLVGLSTLQDPSVKEAQREKAQLKADIAKGPDLLTEEEKSARREAGMAPIQRAREQQQRRTEKIAASTGKFDAASMLAAGEAGLGQVRQAALETEARLAAEDVAREKMKKADDEKKQARVDAINAMNLNLRNENLRRPAQQMIQTAAELTGTALAYLPAKSIDDQVEKLRRLGVDEEEIVEVNKLLATNPKEGRKKIKELTAKAKTTTTEAKKIEADVPEPAKVEEAPKVERPKSWSDGYAEYTLQDDGTITYKSPKSGKTITVKPGQTRKTADGKQVNVYDAIMGKRPEAEEGAVETTEEPAVESGKGPEYTPPTVEDIKAAKAAQETAKKDENIASIGFSSVPNTQFTYKPEGSDATIQWASTAKEFRLFDEDGNNVATITLEDMQNAEEGSFESTLLALAEAENLVSE